MQILTKPTFLVDKEKCFRNIERMAGKVKSSSAILRPHFKTHHSSQIGNWFRDFNVDSCTVSSVTMAQYFSSNGWNDLTIAFPYNPLESDDISQVAQKSTVNILIESEEGLAFANELIKNPVGYFLKVDVGTHRTGIDPENIELIERLVSASTDKIHFRGFVAHAGHTYFSTRNEIEEIYNRSANLLQSLKSRFGGILSYGDTPSCSIVDDLSPFDEIRCGNFVFYDWMQADIGSCGIEDISVCMACPVVAIHKERNEVVIYGGGVHLSKDHLVEEEGKCFGKAVRLKNEGWHTEIIGSVKKLSQEHGIISMSNEEITRVKVGELIGVIPVHSCLAADLQGHYLSTKGQKIEKILKE